MKSSERIEFGDFQTPEFLAREVCRVLFRRGVRPRTIIEPTCGQGAFLCEALRCFPDAQRVIGIDINACYVRQARQRIRRLSGLADAEVLHADFFSVDWGGLIATAPEPLLVIGNPPWVNNSAMGVVGGANLPQKCNTAGLPGIEAITGKSNFDISEWMINALLETMENRSATLAMLCKTRVARRALQRGWRKRLRLTEPAIYRINAVEAFRASVDACLLVCSLGSGRGQRECSLFSNLAQSQPSGLLGCEDGRLVKDLGAYRRWRHLMGDAPRRWRSGIKHDCAKVMEVRRHGSSLRNGLGETIELEDECLYPLLKSSQLARGATRPDRWMIVPQHRVGEDTSRLRRGAPQTWRYLMAHAERLDRRASSIYRGRPRFCVFGVGEYSFAPWKVAISGFYKKLEFRKVGCFEGKPTVLDDTSYFLTCGDEAEADALVEMLNSRVAREFYSAFVFWDAKRPITIEILKLLDLAKLAGELRRPSADWQEGKES